MLRNDVCMVRGERAWLAFDRAVQFGCSAYPFVFYLPSREERLCDIANTGGCS
jgi:hypothetical protein